MNSNQFSKVFPELEAKVMEKLQLIKFYLITSARAEYKITLSYEFTDNDIFFSQLTINRETKEAKCLIKLNDFREQLLQNLPDNTDMKSSVFASLTSILVNSYVEAICVVYHNSVLDHDNMDVNKLIVDICCLNFMWSVLDYPQDQISQKVDMTLHALYQTNQFSDVMEMRDYVLDKTKKISEDLISKHHHFGVYFKRIVNSLLGSNQTQELVPGAANSTDLYVIKGGPRDGN